MAFRIRDLAVLNYAQGFTTYTIRTEDDLATVMDHGWAQDMMDIFSQNDVVFIRMTDGVAVRSVDIVGGIVTFRPLL